MVEWPEWWSWELELGAHLFKRMVDRRFNEADLRVMLEDATGYRPAFEEGRWVVESSHEDRYLEVTFRNGRAIVAYLYLTRKPGDTSVRTERRDAGLLVDFAADGRAIGIEITAPSRVSLAALNLVLAEVHEAPATSDEVHPLIAA